MELIATDMVGRLNPLVDDNRALNYCCAQSSVQKVGRTLAKKMRQASEAPAAEILCSTAFDAVNRED